MSAYCVSIFMKIQSELGGGFDVFFSWLGPTGRGWVEV